MRKKQRGKKKMEDLKGRGILRILDTQPVTHLRMSDPDQHHSTLDTRILEFIEIGAFD